MKIYISSLLACCGCLFGGFVVTTRADVQIQLTAGQLLQNDGTTPMIDGGLLLLVASTTDAVFTPPSATSFTPGSDDVVVSRFSLNSANVGVPGDTTNQLQFSYSGSFGQGDLLELFWFPTLTTAASTPGANTQFGAFRTDTVQTSDGSNIAFVAPADNAVYNLAFLTSSQGGSNPNSAGIASSFTPVPEPSTYALLGLGALVGLTLGVRHRRQTGIA